MIDALRYEWLRIRTVRSTFWLSGVALAFSVAVAVAVSWSIVASADNGGLSVAEIDELGAWLGTQFARAGAPYFVAYLLAMIGILSWGHEYRHGMVRATLTALPSRSRVWVAKYLVALAWIAVTVMLCYLAAVAVGWLFLSGDGLDVVNAATVSGLWRAVLYAVVLGALAMAFTGLIRNQTAALVLLFIWPLAIENIITLIFFLVPALRDNADLTRFLPFGAGARVLSDGPFAPGTTMFGSPLTWVGGLVVFGGIAAVAMVVSLVLLRRRDA